MSVPNISVRGNNIELDEPGAIERVWDVDALALFTAVRAMCGVSVGAECLPPEIEHQACQAFAEIADRLETIGRKPAPAVTLDALIYVWREGEVAALQLPENRARIATLIPRQRTELRDRIEKLAMKDAPNAAA